MVSHQNIQVITQQYLDIFPDEQQRLVSLLERMPFSKSIVSRQDDIGHITVSVLIFSPDKKKVLLIHHRQLHKWLKPGGHLEPEDDTFFDACRRETLEEVGIHDIEFLHSPKNGIPIDIDIHRIPMNLKKNEPEHWHYDLCFVGITNDDRVTIQEREVTEFRWLVVSDVEDDRLKNIFRKLSMNMG